MVKDIIIEKYSSMSKTQKRIANYIIQNITSVSYYNIKKLANETGASEASIIRFCNFLGYRGYPEFKTDIQKLAKEQISIRDRLTFSYDAYDDKEAGVAEIFKQDMNRIENTLTNLDMKQFFEACNEIILANRIYIIAARSAMSLGQFFQYYLNMTLGNVVLISSADCNADSLSLIEQRDVVIGITFERYSKITEKMFDYIADKGAVAIAITDSEVSPIAGKSKYAFFADTSMPTYLDSFVAPLTLINAFLTQIGRMKNVELERRLSQLEEFYKTFEIFD